MINSILIAIIVVLSICHTIFISNLFYMLRFGHFKRVKKQPFVSILVPARNEEDNIENCVRSLLNQDYSNFELIVLNDSSTDKTGEILKRIMNENGKLKVINGKALPKGWLGKHYACHNLYLNSKGEYILFTDADTIHQKDSLSSAINAIKYDDSDLLTLIPREVAITWSEKLVVPIIPLCISSFIPLAIAYRIREPAMSIAIGQFILFKRKSYEIIGGYSAVRNKILDDVSLARNIKEAGLKWRIYNGSKHVACRMYRNNTEVFRGMKKNIFSFFDQNAILFLPALVSVIVALLLPFIVLILMGSSVFGFNLTVALAISVIALFAGLFLINSLVYNYDLFLVALYPIMIILLIYIALDSFISTMSGKLNWKDRNIVKL